MFFTELGARLGPECSQASYQLCSCCPNLPICRIQPGVMLRGLGTDHEIVEHVPRRVSFRDHGGGN